MEITEIALVSVTASLMASIQPWLLNSVKYMKIFAPGAAEPTTHISSMTSPVESP